MAVVGERLLQPEASWQRYVINSTSLVTTYGNWINTGYSTAYFGSAPCGYKFNFKGTKLRIIAGTFNTRSRSIKVFIDGELAGTYSGYGADYVYKILLYEISDLENKEHSVHIMCDEKYADYDAIDIDEDGELLPYDPDVEGPTDPVDPPIEPSGAALLRVTMIDSSEREYQLTTKEIDGFINWYNSTGTKEPSYKLTKHIGTSVSKEYLAFQKIISFEVK